MQSGEFVTGTPPPEIVDHMTISSGFGYGWTSDLHKFRDQIKTLVALARNSIVVKNDSASMAPNDRDIIFAGLQLLQAIIDNGSDASWVAQIVRLEDLQIFILPQASSQDASLTSFIVELIGKMIENQILPKIYYRKDDYLSEKDKIFSIVRLILPIVTSHCQSEIIRVKKNALDCASMIFPIFTCSEDIEQFQLGSILENLLTVISESIQKPCKKPRNHLSTALSALLAFLELFDDVTIDVEPAASQLIFFETIRCVIYLVPFCDESAMEHVYPMIDSILIAKNLELYKHLLKQEAEYVKSNEKLTIMLECDKFSVAVSEFSDSFLLGLIITINVRSIKLDPCNKDKQGILMKQSALKKLHTVESYENNDSNAGTSAILKADFSATISAQISEFGSDHCNFLDPDQMKQILWMHPTMLKIEIRIKRLKERSSSMLTAEKIITLKPYQHYQKLHGEENVAFWLVKLIGNGRSIHGLAKHICTT
uniref:Uncharacterized protein n=1 Tax=Romanomermis culicivorax TaxID=13658 RepID=A0A915L4Z8_ROMCU